MLITAFSMIFILRFIIQPVLGLSVFNHGFQGLGMVALVVAVLLIMAGGNIINDIFDINKDSVNKPGRNIVGIKISEKAAWSYYYVTTLAGVLSGVLAAWTANQINFALIFPVVAGLLYFYSQKYSCIPLLGNIVVALLSAVSFGIVWFFYFFSLSNEPLVFVSVQPAFSVVNLYVAIYMVFAFIVSLLREIVKDIEDYKGDNRFGCRTLPVVYGISTSGILAKLLAFIILGASVVMQIYWLIYGFYLLAAGFVIIDLLLIIIIVRLLKADNAQDYGKVSLMIKLVMLAGIFSMILINFEF